MIEENYTPDLRMYKLLVFKSVVRKSQNMPGKKAMPTVNNVQSVLYGFTYAYLYQLSIYFVDTAGSVQIVTEGWPGVSMAVSVQGRS